MDTIHGRGSSLTIRELDTRIGHPLIRTGTTRPTSPCRDLAGAEILRY